MTGKTSRPIVLTGMMGTGKTMVGEVLAGVLGVPFVDLDGVIERRDGRSVRQIFDEEGESRFRQVETEGLRDILASTDSPFVLSTGGGVVTVADNRRMLTESQCHVILLETSVDELVRRLADDGSRPLLRGDVRAALESLWLAREVLYREVADRAISTDGRSVNEVADAVISEVQELS